MHDDPRHVVRIRYFAPSHTTDSNDFYNALKFYGGVVGATSPDVVVKSDAAKESLSAIEQLGWHPKSYHSKRGAS